MINKTIYAVLLLLFTILLTDCKQKTYIPKSAAPAEHSDIRDLMRGQLLSPQQLVDELSKAPVVLVGEEHSEPLHHAMEQWLITQLAAKRQQGSVLMEMISIDQQPMVTALQQGMKSNPYMRDERLQELLQWRAGWPWHLYRGVVLTALHADSPLLAANLSPDQVAAIYQTPTFPTGEHSADPEVRSMLGNIISAMHGGSMEPQQLTSMLAVQQNRDRFMAQQLRQAPQPALLIAGGYHVAKNLGVPLHMQDLQTVRPVVLVLAATGTEISQKEADYVWFLPSEPGSAE